MNLDSKKWQPRWLQSIVASLGAALVVAGCADSAEDVPEPNAPAPEGTAEQAATTPPSNGLNIQLLTTPDISGNARITIVNNSGTQDNQPQFLVVGLTENPIILRDDGIGADLVRGDHVYSTFAFVRPSDLSKRHTDEVNLINNFRLTSVPSFDGRVLASDVQPVAFDINNFNNHVAVKFNPSGIFVPTLQPSPPNTLMIINQNVVGDGDPTRTWNPCNNVGTKMGAFTFGHLMTEMANQPLTGIDPADFAMQWLQTWQNNQSVNMLNVQARPDIATQIINPWLAASGGVKLDLGRAPFRLLAIVNRLDLRTGSGSYGGATGNAGEARFVFGAVIPGPTCQLLPMTVIFEYGVPVRGCLNVRSWAQQWVALNSLLIGSTAYNAALQAITDQFVLRNAAPAKPNGSALNQLRTNEFLDSPWELRQFNLISSMDVLHETPVFRTPDTTFNSLDPNWNFSSSLDTFIMANKVAIDNGSYAVPLSFAAAPFLGGSAPVTDNNSGYFWGTTTLDIDPMHVGNWNNERQLVSFNTCNGCHAGETLTAFTHINPMTPLGSPAALSGFLTGEMVPDPAVGMPVRHFNDLARRQADLEAVAESTCLFFPPLVPDFVTIAQRGSGSLPAELARQPVPPVTQQGTFFLEDFFKFPVQGH